MPPTMTRRSDCCQVGDRRFARASIYSPDATMRDFIWELRLVGADIHLGELFQVLFDPPLREFSSVWNTSPYVVL
jgi:hypothetical protein